MINGLQGWRRFPLGRFSLSFVISFSPFLSLCLSLSLSSFSHPQNLQQFQSTFLLLLLLLETVLSHSFCRRAKNGPTGAAAKLSASLLLVRDLGEMEREEKKSKNNEQRGKELVVTVLPPLPIWLGGRHWRAGRPACKLDMFSTGQS